MNDEIKEILKYLKNDFYGYGEVYIEEKCKVITKMENQQLLDYITNLEEQLHQASLDIQELTERDIWCPSNCDKLTNLQEELKEANESITWWSNRFKAVEKDNTKLKQEKDKYYEENLIISQEILNLQDENIKLNIKLEDKAYEQLKVSYKKLQEENEQLRTQMNTCKNVKDKAIDKLYCYGEIFDREILQQFQKEMLSVLQGEDNND